MEDVILTMVCKTKEGKCTSMGYVFGMLLIQR